METVAELLQNPPGAFTPLLVAAIVLVVFWQLRTRFDPVIDAVIAGLTRDAERKYYLWAYATLICTAASLQQLAKVAERMGWMLTAAACEVLQPAFVTLIALLPRPVFAPPREVTPRASSVTTPPFPPAQ